MGSGKLTSELGKRMRVLERKSILAQKAVCAKVLRQEGTSRAQELIKAETERSQR